MKLTIKIGMVILLLFSLQMLFSCNHAKKTEETDSFQLGLPPDQNSQIDSDNYLYLKADWPYYSSAEELIAASSHVVEGKVVAVSFQLVDYKKGIFVETYSNSTSEMLYTVYTIEITKTYKGESPERIDIAIIGGLPGVQENEQLKVMKETGFNQKYQKIPVLSDHRPALELNREYLFCLGSIGDYYGAVSITQLSFEKESADYKKIVGTLK